MLKRFTNIIVSINQYRALIVKKVIIANVKKDKRKLHLTKVYVSYHGNDRECGICRVNQSYRFTYS